MIHVGDIYSTRKMLGLSQEQLAEALGVSRNTVSRWELGEFNPPADKLAALEELLAQFEAATDPKDTPAPEDTFKEAETPPPVVPTWVERWPMALVCIGVVCALLIGIASLIGLYSISQWLEPDNIVPAEEIKGEEVGESTNTTLPITLHP